MFENSTLHEAYTGSLIAGKGRLLNNIKVIMDRTRLKNEDWTRVRFGAGTPWRRCWCVITPPDEKDIQKQQRLLRKKSAYERTAPLKGSIKFYDTKKTKKAQPIATIKDAYSAYAIYPQSKPLIDQSTLVKIEGSIMIHSTPETTTDGFVFVMPEVHPAVSGFEMMLRYLFPVYDVFALYGRPNRLIADTLDTRSLMFALPQEKRYGYLEILDVAGMIHETGSQSWSEREWRLKMKELTSARMTRMTTNGRPRSRASSYRGYRNSLPSRAGTLRYEDGASIRSTPSLHHHEGMPPMPPPHSDSAPPFDQHFTPPRPRVQHQRSYSESTPPISTPPRQRSQRHGPDQSYTPSRLSHEQSRPSYEGAAPGRLSHEQSRPSFEQGRQTYEQSRRSYEQAPPPPAHAIPIGMAARAPPMQNYAAELGGSNERSSSESERRFGGYEADRQEIRQEMRPASPPSQVAAPPAFSHEPGARPQKRPGVNEQLRRENSRLSITTLSQLAEAGKAGTTGTAAAGAAAAWRTKSQRSLNGMSPENQGQRGVNLNASQSAITADRSSPEGLVLAKTRRPVPSREDSTDTTGSSQAGPQTPPYYKDKPLMSSYDLLSPQNPSSRAVSPLSQSSIPSPPAQPQAETASARHFSRNNMAMAAATSASSQNLAINKPPPIPMTTERPQVQRSSTSRSSVSRKPVPPRTPTLPAGPPAPIAAPPISSAKSSLDSLSDRYIDEEALNRVLAQQRTESLASEKQDRHRDDEISVYDNDSTVSPDYASTRKSTETRRSGPSIEQPRRGVLKSVGTVELIQQEVKVGDVSYRPGATPEPLNPNIPTVDFGPTQAYNPTARSRLVTSATPMQLAHERSGSSDRFTPSPGRESSPVAQRSPGVYPLGHAGDSHERSPSRNLITPEPQRRSPLGSPIATDNGNRRSVAWQPGAQIGASSPGARQPITPEQFVHQRAAANRMVTPIYAHGRQGSAIPTPPAMPRNLSGEWPVQQQKRQSSYGNELAARSHSWTASTLMNTFGDYTAHLSAREQEHVAKATGSPLINMAGNPHKNAPAQGGGLIGAIEAREREKKDAKQGLSGQAIQQAIAQRQQQSQGQSYQHQRQQSFQVPTPQFAMPGQFPTTPPQQLPVQQQYSWNPQQQQQWASYQQHPQQQYAQPQRQQWTPPAAQQFGGTQPASPSWQQSIQYQGNYQQQGQYGPGQQQYYGPYLGNGQSGRQ